jgi:hypothetical protein
MPRKYVNPHGYKVDLPDFIIRRREPAPRWLVEHQGACANQDPDIFYNEDREAEALAICGPCPKKMGCLHYALQNHEQYGVWGGVPERRRLRVFQSAFNRQGRLPQLCHRCRSPFVRERSESLCPDCQGGRDEP